MNNKHLKNYVGNYATHIQSMNTQMYLMHWKTCVSEMIQKIGGRGGL